MKKSIILLICYFPLISNCQFSWWPWGSSDVEIEWPFHELESYLIFKEQGDAEYKVEALESSNGSFIIDRELVEGYEDFLILPYNGRLTKKSKILDDESLNQQLEIEIGVFGIEPLGPNVITKINEGLKKLYTGLQVNFTFIGNDDIPNFNFAQNQSIVEILAANNYIDIDFDYHVFLDDGATFPDGAGCQAQVIHEKANDDAEDIEHVILSKTSFFDNIFLVIHEICHFFEGNDHNYRYVYENPENQKKYLDIMSSNPFYCRYTHSFNNLKKIHLGVAFERCNLEFYPLVRDTHIVNCTIPFNMDCLQNPETCGMAMTIQNIIDESEFMPTDFKNALIDLAEMQYDIYFSKVSNDKEEHVKNLISFTSKFIKNEIIENLHHKTGLSVKELNEHSTKSLIDKYASNNLIRVPVYDQQNNLIISKKVEISGKTYNTDKFGFITTQLSNKSFRNLNLEGIKIQKK